jgi:predicted DNA-binding protein YlxM (UPF0122 family)
MSIAEAAKIRNVTRQAIYLAIKEGRVRVYQYGKYKKISMSDILNFEKNQHKFKKMFEGEEIFSDVKGLISVPKASELTGLSKNLIYYYLRIGSLKGQKCNGTWRLTVRDLMEFKERHCNPRFDPPPLDESKKHYFGKKNLSK